MGTPTIYVSTWAKYNNGCLKGEWVEISDFTDYEDFISHCREIHSDEEDAELMFQDYENMPENMFSESGIREDDFYNLLEMYYHPDSEAAFAYYSYFGEWDLKKFENSYSGQAETEYDYAVQLVNDCYDLDSTMGSLAYYFDYEKFARDLFAYDYLFVDGYVFAYC